MPSEYIVEVEEVQTGLSKIKLTKAVGPDNVPQISTVFGE